MEKPQQLKTFTLITYVVLTFLCAQKLAYAFSTQNLVHELPRVNINEVGSGQLLFKSEMPVDEININNTADAANNNHGQKPRTMQKYLQAPTLKTEAFIDIKGIVANTKVLQTFSNTTDQWQHALYVFPLPDDAAVNQLTITLGERKIIGVVKEKQQAKNIFVKAQKAGKKAALLEQLRPNLFSMQVANIPPHESIAVELTYFQQVHVENNTFSVHFPMAITPRYDPAANLRASANTHGEPSLHNKANLIAGQDYFPQAPIPNLLFTRPSTRAQQAQENRTVQQHKTHKINLEVSLNSGAPLKKLNSLHHGMLIKEQSAGLFNLKMSDHPLDQDFELVWQYQQQDLPQVVNFTQNYQQNNYGLLMVIPGLAKVNNPQARQLTFILDKSGSMSGQSIEQAKQAFEHALKTLDERDTFQLITFNNQAELFFEQAVAATDFNKNTAWRYVRSLKAEGGTEIKAALKMALDKNTAITAGKTEVSAELNSELSTVQRFKQIVFLTDGAVGNEAEIFTMINQDIGNNRLFTVGLGTAPNRYFMKRAAEAGRGSYQFIGSYKQLVPVLEQLFNKLDQPALTDIDIHFNDENKLFTSSPDPIPDLYADQAIFISYKIEEQATATNPYQAELVATYQGKPWQLPLTINSDAQSTINNPNFAEKTPSLAILWARRKITDYYQTLMLNRDSSAKDKIIALALEFNLVTPFTSLVAVENIVSRPSNTSAHNKQLTNNLPAGQQMPKTSLNLMNQLLLACSLLVLSLLILLIYPWFSEKRIKIKV